jgi:hypothetical protein
MVLVTTFSLEGLKNSPEEEVERNSTSTVSVACAMFPEISCSWRVMVPEISPGLIVWASVVNEILEISAETKMGISTDTKIRCGKYLQICLGISDGHNA